MTRRTILLAEDNPDHALLTVEAIEAAHGTAVDVVVVPGGQEALDYVFPGNGRERAPVPNLILLDIKMPGVDGFEVLRRVKADEHLRVVPVVMLTSSDHEADVLRSYGLGSNSYVTKPVDAEALSERIGQIPGYWFDVNVPPPGEEDAA